MKLTRLFLLSLGSLLFVVGCANEPPAPKQDSRIGGSAGVIVSSHDMSRVVPTRPTPTN
ncbi:MAG: hypothetical protein ABJF10_15355 [Chthoniobacter sp.]|uniref:hypothetical protein n=1 Tax=Chthoniobacter sp. TaxID=2510640 RepID=UPI0032A201DB